MRLFFLAASLLLAGPAAAAAYDDFAQGIAANQRGDAVAALAAFSAAIAGPDLSPSLLPLAYRGRGIAYLRLGRCQSALTDLDTALALKPDDFDTMVYTADTHVCMHDLPGAEKAFTAILAKSPTVEIRAARGRLRWRMGDFAGAAEDFAEQERLLPPDAYAFLWLQLARLRAGTYDAGLAEKASDPVKFHVWPGPLVSFMLDDSTAEEVDRAAASSDTEPAEMQLCEADFFVGEWMLGRKDVDAAKIRLKSAVDRCPVHRLEHAAAAADLGALK